MRDGRIFLKTSALLSLIKAFRMNLISAGSISVNSTFKPRWNAPSPVVENWQPSAVVENSGSTLLESWMKLILNQKYVYKNLTFLFVILD